MGETEAQGVDLGSGLGKLGPKMGFGIRIGEVWGWGGVE